MGGIGGAGDFDGRGVEVDEQVVADDHLRRAGGGADGAAAVGRAALEDVVGDDVLPGAEVRVGLVAIGGPMLPMATVPALRT